MGIVNDCMDEFDAIRSARYLWEKYWREVARFVLPHTASFDRMFGSTTLTPLNAVVDTPVAADRSKHLYDMTSLWGVERLSAGILTLKTPESDTWHNLNVDTDFDYDPSYEEKASLEKIRDYLFKVRSNPKSGFWSHHKAAVKSMCAFGDGWVFVEETYGQRHPFHYENVPLPDVFPALGPNGMPNIMHRSKLMSAQQAAMKYGAEKLSGRVQKLLENPKTAQDRIQVMQCVRPRDGKLRTPFGNGSAEFASYIILPEDKHLVGTGGFYEFPYVRYAWADNGSTPYCEGPVAIALGEIKSLNEMAKNELIASQMVLRPALGVMGKNMNRINLNPGAVNPGLVNGDGNPLFAALNAGIRPDFARVIIDARRLGVRESLYLNLWQLLIEKPDMTATEALIRAQEKGELLGPVGISMNGGLSGLVDREIGILARKDAFKPGSPLGIPESMGGREVAPQFTSPLDRLRRVGELIGIQRLVEFAAMLGEAGFSSVMTRLDPDEIIETAQDILGAPVKVLRDRDAAKKDNASAQQLQQLMGMVEAGRAGGEAARAIGEGGTAIAQGAEAAAASPMTQKMLQGLADANGLRAA